MTTFITAPEKATTNVASHFSFLFRNPDFRTPWIDHIIKNKKLSWKILFYTAQLHTFFHFSVFVRQGFFSSLDLFGSFQECSPYRGASRLQVDMQLCKHSVFIDCNYSTVPMRHSTSNYNGSVYLSMSNH